MTAGFGVTTSDLDTAVGVEFGLAMGDIGVSNACLVGECEGVSSCSSSTSIRFGTPFEITGANAMGAVVGASTAARAGAWAAGILAEEGAAGEAGLGGFFIPISRKSRSTA